MSDQPSYFRLGLFVLVAVGLLVGGVVVLGAGALFKETIMAETYLDESVQGLSVGSPVKHRGVQIGQVSKISFVTSKYKPGSEADEIRFGKYILIEMELDPEKLPKKTMEQRRALLARRVEAGLRFRLQSSLTGPTYVEADYVDPDVHKPLEIDWDPEHLYVPSAPGTMAQVTSAVERLASQIEKAKIAEVVENINTLVVDMDKAVKELKVAKLSEEITGLAIDLRGATNRLHQILNNPAIDRGISDLGAAIAGVKDVVASSQDDVKATLRDLPKITARLASTAEEIDKIIKSPEIRRTLAGLADAADNAGPAMIRLRKTAQRLDNLLASQQRDIEAVILGLRRTIENVTALSEDAKENPSRVLFGSPPPRTNPGDKK